ncbi:MAG: aconitase family protein, partial [Pseudonocardiaceae bacterium]
MTHTAASADSFGTRGTLTVGDTSYEVFRLVELDQRLGTGWRALPYSLKVLLENLLRCESSGAGGHVTAGHIEALVRWDAQAQSSTEIQFTTARVIMQDFTGVPCLVDLATMREAITWLGGDPHMVNPLAPAELVIDHSVIADVFGRPDAFERNVDLEYQRNRERDQFLRWGQRAFDELTVVPPGTGIVHQVNIEHLARTVMIRNGQA